MGVGAHLAARGAVAMDHRVIAFRQHLLNRMRRLRQPSGPVRLVDCRGDLATTTAPGLSAHPGSSAL